MSKIAYKPGDLILTNCQPLFKISNKCARAICEECFECAEENPIVCLEPCSGCSLVNYCSKACQHKDWKNGHCVECGSRTFANNFTQGQGQARVNLRCQLFRSMAYLAMNPSAGEKQFELYNGRMRCFNDLMSHEEFYNQTQAQGSDPLKEICEKMEEEIQAENLKVPGVIIDSKYLLRLGGIFQTNAFTIYNAGETEELGSGIYVQASIFDHSCKPTALFRSKGTAIEIRTIAPIPAGEEPYISYISAHAGKMERQEFLNERYHFECQCVRCAGACACADEETNECVNFDMLNKLINYSSTPQNHLLLLQLHEIILQMMRKIYHEYDARITNQFCRTLQFALANKYLNLTQLQLKNLIQETKSHLKISCGTDHPEFLKIERAIQINYPNLL